MSVSRKLMPLFLVMLSVVIAGCFGGVEKRPVTGPLTIELKAEPTRVNVGGNVSLTALVTGSGADDAEVTWASKEGTVAPKTGRKVDWTAPNEAGEYEIFATAAVGKRSTTGKIRVTVVVTDDRGAGDSGGDDEGAGDGGEDDEGAGDGGGGDEGAGDGGGGDEGELSVDTGSFYKPGAKWEYRSPGATNGDGSYYSIEVIGWTVFHGEPALRLEMRYSEEQPGRIEHLYMIVEPDEIVVFGQGSEVPSTRYGEPVTSVSETTYEPPMRKLRVFRQGETFENTIQLTSTGYYLDPDGQWVDDSLPQSHEYFEAYEILEVTKEPVTTMAGTFHDAVKVVYARTSGLNGRLSTWMEVQWYAPDVGLVKTASADDLSGESGHELFAYYMP